MPKATTTYVNSQALWEHKWCLYRCLLDRIPELTEMDSSPILTQKLVLIQSHLQIKKNGFLQRSLPGSFSSLCPILTCYFLLYVTLFYYCSLDTSLFSNDRQKVVDLDEWGTGRIWGRENYILQYKVWKIF